MILKQLIFTESDCYKRNKWITPTGIMVHSTGANNPWLKRYVGPDDGIVGKNIHNNHWNMSGVGAYVHAFIGKAANGEIMTYQTLPWSMRGWHCASGPKGSGNNNLISFEICEDDLKSKEYFDKVYKEAVELCVYLCKEFTLTEKDIICHSEGYQMGIASNHGDVMHWFPKYGKSMNTFRADVKKGLEDEVSSMTKEELREFIVDTVKSMGMGEAASSWAVKEVEQAKKMGLTDGSNPKRLATREEVMIMTKRVMEKIKS